MKVPTKEIKKTIKQFRSAVKDVPCSSKQNLYWELLEECMEKNDESVEFVREKWRLFTNERIKKLEKKLGIN